MTVVDAVAVAVVIVVVVPVPETFVKIIEKEPLLN